MKILQVIPRFNPALGGGVNVVYNISKFMAMRGHDVTIITTNYKFDIEYSKIIGKEGVEVIPFDYLFNLHLFIPSPTMKDWLSKNIKKYDIIHLNGARAYQNNIIYKYAVKYDVPYVLQTHGSILRIIEIQRLKRLYDIIWGYKLYKGASKVIALTQSEAEACISMGVTKNKVEIIPNGVDLNEFNNFPRKGKFREKYSIGNNEKLILYLGRLHKSKGIALLLKAFSDLIKDLDDAKLIFVGPDDGYKNKLEKLANDLDVTNEVIFTGHVSENEKMMALIDADVFVTPRFYGFPITFLEALACGVPIITTTEGDFIEGFNNEVGFVVEYDKKELKSKLVEILVNDELKKRFKENAKKKSNDYDWRVLVEKMERMYEGCLAIK